jgi:hypothetical protein
MEHFDLLIQVKDLQVTKTAPADKTKKSHRHRTKAPDRSENSTAVGGKTGIWPIKGKFIPVIEKFTVGLKEFEFQTRRPELWIRLN